MNNSLKKKFAKIMSLALLTSVTVGSFPSMAKAEETSKLLNMPLTAESKEKILKNFKENLPENQIIKNKENQEDSVRLIVECEGKTAQDLVGKGKRATGKEASMVETDQAPIRAAVESLEGISVRHSYTNVFNGFSVDAKIKDIENIKAIDGVKSVREASKYTEDMNKAKKLTQVEDVWKNHSLKGEGMVVAIVDTGIDYKHKDFANPKDSSKLKLNDSNIKTIKDSGVLKANKDADTYFTEKIPFGYNYADNNNEIVDLRDAKAPHGAHVAGIVGADGDEKLLENNDAVKGVAPQTQLLAMKVFSNGPLGKYCYSDDELAAIDDAVALGADVINMSLGSPAGFRNDVDPVQEAITRATDAGVMVVVSAGNESNSTDPYGIGELNDQITVGNPATSKDALMVASYENTHVANQKMSFKDAKGTLASEGVFAEHQVDYKSIYNKNYEIVNGGIGKPEELGNVKGKVALIKRGGLSFIDKILNAQAKGAVGVIIYNNDGDETLISMAQDPNIKIPALFVGNSTGAKIIKSQNKVLFNGEVKNALSENVHSGDYSDFTSWGPSPSLEFKPQIAAPGGQIYSTLNAGSHGVMSGTSMSAPHTSGVMTLLLQGIKEYAPELSGREKIDYAKQIIMNTAKVEIDKKNNNIPFSPRRQGAGLTQVEDAVRNKVTVTNNGQAAVELKEIKGDKATFTLNIKNHGNEEAKYEIAGLGGVLTQDKVNGTMIHDKELSSDEANLTFSTDKITVPAKGETKVDVTLNVGSKLEKEQYLEGYIKLTSSDSKVPSLTVPYMGFYGDWSKENMTTNNAWDDNKHVLVEVLKEIGQYKDVLVENLALTHVENQEDILGVTGKNEDGSNKYEGGKIAISPNGDKVNDDVFPGLYLMRNAKKISAEVLDENGKTIRNIGNVTEHKKKIISSSDANKIPDLISELAWDGTVFNKEKGNFENVKDGKYTYRVKMQIDYNGAKEQVVEMPVKVDTVGPNVEVNKFETVGNDTVKVYFTATDDFSGVNSNANFPIFLNGKLNEEATKQEASYDEKTGTYYKTVKGLINDKLNQIEIGAFDYAKNLGGTQVVVPVGKIEPVAINFDDKTFNAGQIEINEDKYIVSGTMNRPIKELIINDERIPLVVGEDGVVKFSKELNLKQGITIVNVKAVDYDNKVLINHGYKIYCDSEKPVINIVEPELVDGTVKMDGSKLTLKGNVSDNLWGYKFYVNGELYKNMDFSTPVGPEKNKFDFSLDFNDVKAGEFIELKAVDGMGNTELLKIQIVE